MNVKENISETKIHPTKCSLFINKQNMCFVLFFYLRKSCVYKGMPSWVFERSQDIGLLLNDISS